MLNKERQQYACVQQIGVIYLAKKLQKGGSLYIAKGYRKFSYNAYAGQKNYETSF